MDFPDGEEAKQMKLQAKTENMENDFHTSYSQQYMGPNSRSYQYGPFSPVTAVKGAVSEPRSTKRIHDLESLSSTFRPQYQNQGTF